MVLAIILFWSALLIISVLRNKLAGFLLFLILFVNITIPIFGLRINSLYYFTILLFVLILIKRDVKWTIDKDTRKYCLLLILILLTYSLGWLCSGAGSLIGGLIGCIKFIPIIVEFSVLFQDIDKKTVKKDFGIAINIVVFLNTVMVVLQKINPSFSTTITDIFFYNDDTINSSDQIINGVMTRCYGIFNHPATLGTFSLFAITYNVYSNYKAIIRYPFIVCSFIIGLLSLSKTFVLGFPMIVIIMLLVGLKKCRSLRTIVLYLSVIVTGIIVILNFETIISVLSANNAYMRYYLSTLYNPFDAFQTRYSREEGALSFTYEIIKENFLIGVGPNSIKGEAVLDSAPVVIAHNGGVIGLILVTILLLYLLVKIFKTKQNELLLLWAVVLVSGFALPTWIFHMSTIGATIYIIQMVKRPSYIEHKNNNTRKYVVVPTAE